MTINVGGREFKTTLTTLRSHPTSLLAEKFSEESLKKIDADNARKQSPLFIDRNPDAFESVLEYLRTGKPLHTKLGISQAVIDEEFRFWRVAPTYVESLTPNPAYTLADQIRQRTVSAMLREGTTYIDVFLRILRQELELAAQNAKSELYLTFGAPPTSTHKGKPIHDANLHKWLSLRRAHLSLLAEAIAKEGFTVQIASGLPEKDWIWLLIQWPLVPNEPIKGTFNFE